LADVFAACQEISKSDRPAFLSLPEKHIDLDEIIYASMEKSRKYPMDALIWVLII